MINEEYLIQELNCYIGILTNMKQPQVYEVSTITKSWMKFSMHLKRDIFKFKDNAQAYLMSHMTEDLNVIPTTILKCKRNGEPTKIYLKDGIKKLKMGQECGICKDIN
jgi:hypothetical protein